MTSERPEPRSLAIGQRLAEAREDARLTQAELAALVGLERSIIAKIEAGQRKLSATELVHLAAVLDRPIDWFVAESPAAVVSRRQDPAAGGWSVILDRRIERLARDVEFLEREGILPEIDVVRLDVPETVSDSEASAFRARELMGITSGPILDLQRHAEILGLLGFSLDLGPSGGDAGYVSIDKWGVAVINGTADPGRRRFSLAHELGHHLFSDAYAPEVSISPGSDTERVINAFAVHLLLPRADVEEVWREHDDRRLAAVDIAVRFRASWTAVCAQLKNVELLDELERARLASDPPTAADFIELGERWLPELDPPSVPPEYGRRVVRAYRSGRLTAARTTELLWGTVGVYELPEQQAIPIEGWRREFDGLP